DGDVAYVGITDFAQKELGDMVFVDIDTVGETIEGGERFGSIEAVKTVAELLLPVKGEILEFNSALEDDPAAINRDAYASWIVKIKVADPAAVNGLMTADQYKAHIGA
ncbi:MAG: glycine cleavage system protein H, partial [Bacteroidales bacterium]|nr:glycine cleavage system protein H [Bacteroidales bacterium]